MKKQLIVPVFIILLVVFAILFFAFTDSSSNSNGASNDASNDVKINDACGTIDSKGIHVADITYSLLEGYKQGETNDFGHISITDGSNEIYFGVFDDKSINDLTSEYVAFTESNNQTATNSNFTENGIDVTRYVNDQTGANHCWFNYKGKVYTIYTWVETPNDDEIMSNLINSI